MEQQLPENIMRKAVKGISYIAHPLRLRILEYLDVNGSSSVSAITKALGEEQVIISQSLKKMREANLVRTNRRGIFIYYDICEEYPASIFTCLRKLYAMMTDNFYFLEDGVKAILPSDYTMMTANRIKLFANYDKMRILEFLTLYGPQNVTEIVNGIGSEQLKVSQYLKRLKTTVLSSRGARDVLSSMTLRRACTKPASNAFTNATIRLKTKALSDFRSVCGFALFFPLFLMMSAQICQKLRLDFHILGQQPLGLRQNNYRNKQQQQRNPCVFG